MDDLEVQIQKIFADGDARSARIKSLLPASEDLIGLVLRGHLIAEELLFAACAAYCQDPDHLKAARLRFPQLVSLLRSLEKISAVSPEHWAALLELNSFRNALAHQLEHKDLEGRTARFVDAVKRVAKHATLPEPATSREALTASLHFLIGGLEVVAVWHEALETLFKQRALEARGDAPVALPRPNGRI